MKPRNYVEICGYILRTVFPGIEEKPCKDPSRFWSFMVQDLKPLKGKGKAIPVPGHGGP
jgi:hypothetical protein